MKSASFDDHPWNVASSRTPEASSEGMSVASALRSFSLNMLAMAGHQAPGSAGNSAAERSSSTLTVSSSADKHNWRSPS